MKLNKSLILACIIASLLIIIVFLKKEDYTDKGNYAKFFPELIENADLLSKIEVISDNNSIYLIKKGEKWYLPELENYPAAINKINQLLLRLSNLKIVDKKTNNPDNHLMLGLGFPIQKDSFRIRLFHDNEVINDFIIGNQSKHNDRLSYIRKYSENQTWLFKNNLDIFNQEINWSEDSIVRFARWRIKSINIESANNPDENIFIFKEKYSDQMFKLANMPKEYEVKSAYSLTGYASLLESVKKEKIKRFPKNKNIKIVKFVNYNTFDGIKIKIKLFDIDNEIYAHFSVDSDISIRKELPKEEPEIVGLPNMMSFKEVEVEANNYGYIGEWLYKLDHNTEKELLKPFSEIIKKKEAKNN